MTSYMHSEQLVQIEMIILMTRQVKCVAVVSLTEYVILKFNTLSL